jgi:hypothetical protein
MKNGLNVTIEAWSAWAPGVETAEQWQEWAHGLRIIKNEGSPSTPFLSPMFRRRLSRLSKMALKVAHDCVPDIKSIKTVFCSRRGELVRSFGLLREIVAAKPISPTGFSMSVHNTASGLFSIARKDTASSTAIAAGKATFESAFMEAAALLKTQQAKIVLLVISDEPAPVPFNEYQDEKEQIYAAAFLLSNSGVGDVIALSMKTGQIYGAPDFQEQHALTFLRFFLNFNLNKKNEHELLIPGERISWQWTRLC